MNIYYTESVMNIYYTESQVRRLQSTAYRNVCDV
jgi:hypothetical protein